MTHKKPETLRCLISDSTTYYKNSVKETRQWANRETEETNLNMKSIRYEIRKMKYQNVSIEQTYRKKKSEPSQNEKKTPTNSISTNTQSTDTPVATTNRVILEIMHSKSEAQVKNQLAKTKPGNISIIMDSNRKFICFKELLEEE